MDALPRSDYFAGLDLGPVTEATGLAIVAKTAAAPEPARYAVRYLERFPPGTPYPEICTRVAAHLAEPMLATCKLAVDQTAVGQPVVDLLRRTGLPVRLYGVTLTAGPAAAGDAHHLLVPKKELIAMLQILLQARRLQIASSLAHAPELCQELAAYRVRPVLPVHDAVLSWRERPHDDLLLALGLAVWLGERWPEPYTGPLVYDNAVDSEGSDREHLLPAILAALDAEEDATGWWAWAPGGN